jgi:hypothetical protein
MITSERSSVRFSSPRRDVSAALPPMCKVFAARKSPASSSMLDKRALFERSSDETSRSASSPARFSSSESSIRRE